MAKTEKSSRLVWLVLVIFVFLACVSLLDYFAPRVVEKRILHTGEVQAPAIAPTGLAHLTTEQKSAPSEVPGGSQHKDKSIAHWIEAKPRGTEVKISGNPLHKPCPDCMNGGVCNPSLGVCNCRSGFNGTDCSEADAWPCNFPNPEEMLPIERHINSMCWGSCNTNNHKCFCGDKGKFPDRPLRYCDPVGPAVQHEWPLLDGLQRSPVPYEKIWSSNNASATEVGWCDADPQKQEVPAAHCSCIYEGYGGKLCDIKIPHVCPNQCNGRGECYHGLCMCKSGWAGADCSVPYPKQPAPAAAEAAPAAQRRPLIYVYELPSEFNSQ
ncbi:hypothetical protein CYMTET_16171, partial [Cymbomonas tetramitiformis]